MINFFLYIVYLQQIMKRQITLETPIV